MKIIKARKEDAPFIAQCIVWAVGEEVCAGLAGENHTIDDIIDLFTRLAAREDSQYSYLNTLAAVDDNGEAVGVCVGYDGAKLHELREPFFEAARELLGLELGKVGDETDGDEFYLDTLAVKPEYRGQGIAGELLKASVVRARECGKPAGLLVEKNNHGARRLYEKVGFRQVGERPFCFVMMDHLQYADK